MSRDGRLDSSTGEIRLLRAPTVEIVDKWRGEYPPAAVARSLTGHNRETGGWTVGVGLRNRNNGTTTRVEIDLWRLGYDLNDSGQELLRDYWQLQNRDTPARLLKRMERHFGQTYVCFDALVGQVNDWRDILQTVLGDAGSYVELQRDFTNGNAGALTSG